MLASICWASVLCTAFDPFFWCYSNVHPLPPLFPPACNLSIPDPCIGLRLWRLVGPCEMLDRSVRGVSLRVVWERGGRMQGCLLSQSPTPLHLGGTTEHLLLLSSVEGAVQASTIPSLHVLILSLAHTLGFPRLSSAMHRAAHL